MTVEVRMRQMRGVGLRVGLKVQTALTAAAQEVVLLEWQRARYLPRGGFWGLQL